MSNPKFEKGMREAMRNSQRAKLRNARRGQAIFGAAFLMAVIANGFLFRAADNAEERADALEVEVAALRMQWNDTADAPPLQRVTVITEGFKDKKGTWRSFDNGEPITVTEWRP